MNLRFLFSLLSLAVGLPLSSVRAQAVAPAQGGEVGLGRVTATTMELRFGTTGTGQGRVVTMAALSGGQRVPLAAADDTFYTGHATFGQGSPLGAGFVVYSGPGHSVTVTGLQPSTSYYITNAEYNADGPRIAYNTRGTSTVVTTAAGSRSSTPPPLPIELTAFSGTVERGLAVLRWATATERNSAHFALERSADGLAFAEAGRVAAAGSSAQPLSYAWSDSQVLAQRTYYRLRQTDLDGAMFYSTVVTLTPAQALARQAETGRLLEVYPNPSAGQPVQLALQGYQHEPLTLRLADALGRLVLTETLTPAAAQYRAPLPLPAGLAAGTYVLTLAGPGRQPLQKRLIISK